MRRLRQWQPSGAGLWRQVRHEKFQKHRQWTFLATMAGMPSCGWIAIN